MATSAAARRGKARLDAFRAAKKTAVASSSEASEGDVRRGDGADATTVAEDFDYRHVHHAPAVDNDDDRRDGAARATTSPPPPVAYVVSTSNPFADVEDEYGEGDAFARSVVSGTVDEVSPVVVRDAVVSSLDVSNAYSVLADQYSGVVAEKNREEETEEERAQDESEDEAARGVLGVTTSTSRAREQYERVMRALESDDKSELDIFQRSRDELKAPDTPTTIAAPELEAIIESVRADTSISAATSRSVREDQSEIAMLQDVIDDMTSEKLGLMRGLQKSQAMMDELATENDLLTQRYNETKSQLTHVQSELDKLWIEFQQSSAMNNVVTHDRDSLSMSAVDANERVHALAAEVVNLEERLHEHDAVKAENERLLHEMKAANARRAHVELVLDATREEQRLFKEKIRDSELMKKLEKFDDDESVFLCAWLMKKDLDSEQEARAKADTKHAELLAESDSTGTSIEVDDEQMQLLTSINELLGELEIEKKTLAGELKDANDAKRKLVERNELLESELAKVMRRLERGDDGWSDEEEEQPRKAGLFGIFRRRR
jgi:hypothetical protein